MFPFISRIAAFAQDNSLLVLLVISGLYLALLLTSCGHIFIINDEVAIESHIRDGKPVKYIPYLSTLCMSSLYAQVSPAIPWYGLTLYSIHLISISVSLSSLMKFRPGGVLLIPFVLLCLLIYAPFIVTVSYTSTSILVGTSGLIAFLFLLSRRSTPNLRAALACGLLFSISYLVRKDGLLAASVFSAPVLFLFLRSPLELQSKRLLVFLAPTVILVSVNAIVERSSFSDDYHRYLEFDEVRYQIHETHLEKENFQNDRILKANRWTQNDYFLLTQYIYPHEGKYNIRTLQNILDHSASPNGGLNGFSRATETIKKDHAGRIYVLLILLLFSLRDLNRKRAGLSLLYLSFIMSGFYYFIMFERFPPRIGQPLFFTGIAMMAVLAFGSGNQETRRKGGRFKRSMEAVSSILLITVLFPIYSDFPLHRSEFRTANRIYDKNVEYLEKHYRGKLVVVQPGCLRDELANPLKVYNHEKEIGMISLGWQTFSPRFYETINSYGMKKASEIWPRIMDDRDAYFVGNEYAVRSIILFIKETYGIDCTAVGIENLSIGPTVYRLRSV